MDGSAWQRRFGGIPQFQRPAVRGGEHVEVLQGSFAIGDDGLDELFECIEPAEDGGLVVEIGVVFALDDEAFVGLHEVEEEVEVDELFRVGFDVEFQTFEVDLVEAVLIDVEDHGNQGHAAGVARQVEFPEQAAEGVVLMVIGFEDLLLDFGGEGAERAVCGGVRGAAAGSSGSGR